MIKIRRIMDENSGYAFWGVIEDGHYHGYCFTWQQAIDFANGILIHHPVEIP